MPNTLQTAGYATAFRLGEMTLENGERIPIIEFEYRPNPKSPDQEKMNAQLAFRLEVANRLLQELKRKVDEIEDGKASLN